MKAFVVLLFTSLLVSMLVSCSNKGNQIPVDAVEETGSFYGYIFPSDGLSFNELDNITVHIHGKYFDKISDIDSTGYYHVTEIPYGNYIITPSKDGYHFAPRSRDIVMNGDEKGLQNFCCLHEDDIKLKLFVTVDDSDTVSVSGVTLHLSGNNNISKTTNEYGFCRFAVSMGSIYTLTPEMKEEGYTFEPESLTITPDEYSEYSSHYGFTALYYGPPLNSISGMIANYELQDKYYYNIELEQNGKTILRVQPDRNGGYRFNHLKDGIYTVNFSFRKEIMKDDYTCNPESITVTVDGEDQVLPDVTKNYTGPTSYVITGKVADNENNGISEVDITLVAGNIFHTLTTSADGYYSKEFLIGGDNYNADSINFLVKPEKDGFYFTPADTTFTLFRQIDLSDGGNITMPDFIGYSFQTLDASDYFPLIVGSAWTYERSEDNKAPYDFTVSITGIINHNGKIFRQFSAAGPWKFTDYRIFENNVYAYSDNAETLFLDFTAEPGREWQSGTIAGTYIRKGTIIGTETVETPAGIFENCARFGSKVVYGETSFDSYDLWYAPGIGLVKSVKIVENYGRRLEYVVDTLKAYEIR